MNKVELKKLLQDSIELLENGRNPTEVSNKLLDRTISELPDFKTFLKKELVDDIDTALFYGYNSSTKEALKDSKRAVPVIAENLINDREHIIGNMISPNLDSIYLKKMKEDSFYENVKERVEDEKRLTTFKEDWNDTEELKVAMKSGYEEILSDEVLMKKVEDKIKSLSPFLSEYNVELDFLNQGELKVVSNTLSEELGLKKEFDDVEIFKDLTKQKDLEFDFKEETVNSFNKNCELGLKDIFEDWRTSREKAILTGEVKGMNIDVSSESTREDFYQYLSTFGKEKIKDKMLLEEISLFDDYEVDKSVLKSLEDNYNKEHNINDFKGYMITLNKEQEQMKEDKELLEKFRKKDNLISNKDLKHFNEQINENKKDFLDFLKEKDYLEKVDDENYKIKDDIFKKDGFEKILSDYEDETMYCFHTRENIFRGNLTDEELLERYDIKKEDFIIYSQNGDKLYDSESSLPTRDLEEYIIDIKGEEYWENLKLNDVKSWDNLLKENLVIGQMKSTEEEFEDYEEYTRNHLEEIADYTITEAKLIFGEVREDLIRNSEKGLISEEKLEMLENRYSNSDEKEVKATEKDSRVKSEEYWLNKVENNKDKYKEEISNIKANFLSSFLKDNIPNYEKMSSAIELPKEDLKEKLNGNFNDYCLENYIWENDSLKEKIHNSFPLNEMVKRYGLEDELPAFKVYDNEDELLFDSGSKENNIKEIESFLEKIDKTEFLNELLQDTNINKIENWSKIANYDDNELMTITFNNDFFFEEETEYINSNNYEEYLGMNLTEKIDDNIDYEVLSYTNTVKDKLLELIDEKEVLTKKDTEKLIEDLSSNSKEKVVKEIEEVKEKNKEMDM